MNDSKNILSNSSNQLIHIIYHQSIPDQFVLEWQKETKFDLNCDYQTFLKFVKINFNVDFKFEDPKSISKGKWVSTRENDIMLMETRKDKLLCQYIKSYNDYVSIDKGDLMPRFTLECRKLYLQQNEDMKKMEQEFKNQNAELEKLKTYKEKFEEQANEIKKLKKALQNNGIKLDNEI
ncbi:hypothetical protein [Spiroplasma culicicola]|uniref:Uncharacterized protein n=1 Tax=Spiroplasma culicicola AES-1 TaxID=1276246 RepID=W6AHT8_9MOLU|nr:hypothetical protein [Spiroplasma culicicola]AHI53254.1 hypothetical protein SCULI_v1c09140 [Spiroplasma culicicola AES-1]